MNDTKHLERARIRIMNLEQERDKLRDLVMALSDACEVALADTLKPQHLQEPDKVIPMLKAAIRAAHVPK